MRSADRRESVDPSITPPIGRRLQPSDAFVLEVPLALQGFGVLVLAQNIFIELHVGAAKVLKEAFDALLAAHYLIGQIIYIEVDADRADDSKFRPEDRDRGALDFSRSCIQVVVELVLVLKVAAFLSR